MNIKPAKVEKSKHVLTKNIFFVKYLIIKKIFSKCVKKWIKHAIF